MKVKNSLADDMPAGCAFAVLVIMAVVVAGWCLNIWKLAYALSEPLTALVVLRIVGIVFAPIGAVVGFV